jgi:hypothetical protein
MIFASNSGEVRAEKIENHCVLFRSQDLILALSFRSGMQRARPSLCGFWQMILVLSQVCPRACENGSSIWVKARTRWPVPARAMATSRRRPGRKTFSVARENPYPPDRLSCISASNWKGARHFPASGGRVALGRHRYPPPARRASNFHRNVLALDSLLKTASGATFQVLAFPPPCRYALVRKAF